MAITVVQTKAKNDFNTAGDMSLSFDTTPTVGNAIIVVAQGYFTSPTWPSGACTDNQGNTYVKAHAYQQGATPRWGALYYCLGTPTASGTFTVTMADGGTGTAYGTLAMLEVSGLDAFEGFATRQTSTSAATMTVTRTVAAAAGLVVAQYGPFTGMTAIGVQGGFTVLSQQLSDATCVAETDYLVTSVPTGDFTVTWNLTPNGAGAAACAFFTEAAASGRPVAVLASRAASLGAGVR